MRTVNESIPLTRYVTASRPLGRDGGYIRDDQSVGSWLRRREGS